MKGKDSDDCGYDDGGVNALQQTLSPSGHTVLLEELPAVSIRQVVLICGVRSDHYIAV